MSSSADALSAGVATRRGSHRAPRLRRIAAIAPAPGVAAIYLSLLVLLPIAAVLAHAFSNGWSGLWSAIDDRESRAALELSLGVSFIVVAINAVAGTAIAWLLVRDRFPLNRVIGAFVDLPFALPTIIAGVTLLALYGPSSPFGINIAYTRLSIALALLFVTLPFSVRSVQPVLAALDRESEEAAASLGAGPFTTFRRITLPSILPAIITGAGLGFARAVGEYGSVVLLSGNLPFKTEVGAVRIFNLIQSDNDQAAAAVSLALFVVALVVLAIFGFIRRRFIPIEEGK